MNSVALAVSVSFIPFIAVWAANFLSSLKFSKTITAQIQALAAGFLLSSIFLDLMPRVLKGGVHFSYIIAFVVGFIVMLILEGRGDTCCSTDPNDKKSLRSFLFPFAVEFFITAVLIGVAASSSVEFLIIIAVSFAFCNFVCGLTVSLRLHNSPLSALRRFFITLMLTALFPIVSYLSAILVYLISKEWLNDLFTFAVAALLYLIANELLPGALEGGKRRALIFMFSAMTFVFLLLFFIQ